MFAVTGTLADDYYARHVHVVSFQSDGSDQYQCSYGQLPTLSSVPNFDCLKVVICSCRVNSLDQLVHDPSVYG